MTNKFDGFPHSIELTPLLCDEEMHLNEIIGDSTKLDIKNLRKAKRCDLELLTISNTQIFLFHIEFEDGARVLFPVLAQNADTIANSICCQIKTCDRKAKKIT